MAVNLVELISSAITPDAVHDMSQVLGESGSAVQAGIGALVPALVGGMAAQASTPSGASELLAMVNSPNVDAGLAGNIALLSSGQPHALLDQGSNLVGGLFDADKASGIASALSGMTGMKAGSATSLLAMIVPIVLSVLKRFFGENRFGATEVMELFAGQKKNLEGALDPRLTAALGLGSAASLLSVSGDTAVGAAHGMGATARASAAGVATAATAATASVSADSGTKRWMPWALAAVIAAVLLWMFPRSGTEEASVATAPAPATAPATTTAGSAYPTAAAPTTESTPAPATTAMGAAPASLPAKIYFETAKWELGSDSTAVVQSVASMLAADPSAKVDLTGFTDKSGDTAANEALGKKRATAVKNALEAAGVAPARVDVKTPASVEIGDGNNDAQARRVDIAAAK